MKIGLLRHFPVEEPLPTGWMTARQLQQWRVRYDDAEATPGPIDLGGHVWARCLSSDLQRAYVTAQSAHTGLITQTRLLREAEFDEFRSGNLLLPVWIWRWILRLTWLTGHRSQRSKRDDFRQRVKAVADMLEVGSEDTLVVSHAGMMAYLSKELVRRGFRGPRFRMAENARLYVFEKL